ncbi:hypothetical protein [Streptomyces sp. B6B3]|uniref:hypothetical protein n=1 Tax=Streptomyces sp. B6B3 TaxID=3153570 RepID=UPI00325CD6B2
MSLALFSVVVFVVCAFGAVEAKGNAPWAEAEATAACEPTGPQLSTTVVTGGFPVRDPSTAPEKHTIAVLEDLQLCAGRPHRFLGGIVATVSQNMLMGTDVRCVPTDGDVGTPQEQAARRSAYSTRNHGDPANEPEAIAVRWLFEPDRDGTYDCEVRGWGQTSKGTSGSMTIVPHQNTKLSVSGVEDGGREWVQDADRYLCNDPEAQDPVCGTATYVLRDEFQADADARSIDVYAGVEASICAREYKDCTDTTAGFGDFVVGTELSVTQLSNDGGTGPCDGAQTHVDELTTRVAGAGQLNHTKIHQAFDAPIPVVVNSDCSRTFAIGVRAEYLMDDPDNPNHGGLVEGRIPDGLPTDPEALNRYYTSAMATNNF